MKALLFLQFCLLKADAYNLANIVYSQKSNSSKFDTSFPYTCPLKSNDSTSTSPYQPYGTLHTLQNLSYWAYHEESLATLLQQRLSIIQKEIKFIKEYLKDYNETSATALKHAHKHEPNRLKRNEIIGSSFVLGHRMITRYTSVVKNLKGLLKSSSYKESKENVESVLFNNSLSNSTFDEQKGEYFTYPSTPDHFMSSLAFMHLRQIYNYKPSDLRHGLTIDTKSGGVLNALNCAELGMLALERKYYYMAVDWLELAKSLSLKDDTISPDLVSTLLNIAIKESNQKLVILNLTPEEKMPDYSTLDSVFVEPTLGSMNFSDRIRGVAVNCEGTKNSDNITMKAISQYWDLCNGDDFQTPKTQAKLKCYYDNRRHPYLYINPVKVEHLSESPPLFQFYEVIGPKEIKRIIKSYSKYMGLFANGGQEGIGNTIYDRSSVGGDIRRCPILTNSLLTGGVEYNAMKLAEYYSGLKLFNNSEAIQLAEYTYGRYFDAHLDTAYQDKQTSSDPNIIILNELVATLQYYLKVPTLGGRTPFPSAGISARHIRGSVVLWYNMYRNGTARKDVIHGGCPVIHGTKIILNHWVKYGENFQNFQCALNRDK